MFIIFYNNIILAKEVLNYIKFWYLSFEIFRSKKVKYCIIFQTNICPMHLVNHNVKILIIYFIVILYMQHAAIYTKNIPYQNKSFYHLFMHQTCVFHFNLSNKLTCVVMNREMYCSLMSINYLCLVLHYEQFID